MAFGTSPECRDAPRIATLLPAGGLPAPRLSLASVGVWECLQGVFYYIKKRQNWLAAWPRFLFIRDGGVQYPFNRLAHLR